MPHSRQRISPEQYNLGVVGWRRADATRGCVQECGELHASLVSITGAGTLVQAPLTLQMSPLGRAVTGVQQTRAAGGLDQVTGAPLTNGGET